MKRILVALALALVFIAFSADSCFDNPDYSGSSIPGRWNGQYSVDGTRQGTIINNSGEGTLGDCPAEEYSGGVSWHLIAGTCH
jgi:hypothetical protein